MEDEENMILFGDKILKSNKKEYKRKFSLRRTLNNVWQFLDKETFQVKNELTFKKMPDKFYDKIRKEVVDSHNSAFVQIIMERMYKENCINLTGWRKNDCKRANKCRKCKTKIIAVPITDKHVLQYNREYVFTHQDEFKLVVKCKIYDITAPEIFYFEYIDINEINNMSITRRNIYIKKLLIKGVPKKVLMKYLQISQRQLYRIEHNISQCKKQP